jgi:hypothetical protein
MAAHMQQQVLSALVAVLVAAETRAGERVFLDRVDNLDAGVLPAILVDEDPNGEVIEQGTLSDIQNRALAVTVKCVLPITATTAADARAFGLEVEKGMRTSGALTAIRAVCSAYAITASRLEQVTQGDRTYAQRVQDWSFTYHTRRGTPDAKA